MPIRDKIRPEVRDIVAQLVSGGHETYIVGGAVRDLLMDVSPKDYDIATAATPEDVRRVFGRRRCRIIGRRFRLAHVYAGKEIYEVSTFRREPTEEERRERVNDDGVMIWRDNEFGDLEQDAKRRDFTVNALYYDPVGERGIIDYVGGLRDLDQRCARAIGDPGARIEEDPVRALRGLKLVGQFGFHLHPDLEHAIRERGAKIAAASQSRLFEELLKILGGCRAAPIIQALQSHGVLASFWPTLSRVWDTPVGQETHAVLAERDRRMETGEYCASKTLSLASAALPCVASRLGGKSLADLWDHTDGVEHHCREAVEEFFAPLPVSRFFAARVRDTLLVLPRFRNHVRKSRLLRHPAYKYGRELYSILITVCGWDPRLLEEWPIEEPEGSDESSKPRPKGKPRRRRRGDTPKHTPS